MGKFSLNQVIWGSGYPVKTHVKIPDSPSNTRQGSIFFVNIGGLVSGYKIFKMRKLKKKSSIQYNFKLVYL